jgi:hypothetical protein
LWRAGLLTISPFFLHPHLHAIVSDGLFARTGTFYVMPELDLKPLEEIFRASVSKPVLNLIQ